MHTARTGFEQEPAVIHTAMIEAEQNMHTAVIGGEQEPSAMHTAMTGAEQKPAVKQTTVTGAEQKPSMHAYSNDWSRTGLSRACTQR